MFKYTHGNVPVSVSQLFRTNNEYHNYNTRNCAHIHVPVGTTEASYRTFGYRRIYIWNHMLVMKQNSLKINEDKTEFIIFSNKPQTKDCHSLSVGNNYITLSGCIKILGVTLDSK